MAHFARIESNVVVEIIIVNNNELLVDGIESEAKGIEFCQSIIDGEWKQTSYNNTIRKNYAVIGGTYDEVRDAFIPPRPTEGEWDLDEATCQWVEKVTILEENLE
jgi:hypothetical protein